jgi:tRNA threonylcarbamoyladenosine modification (KEOPS) complex  Pcc1 subunit
MLINGPATRNFATAVFRSIDPEVNDFPDKQKNLELELYNELLVERIRRERS